MKTVNDIIKGAVGGAVDAVLSTNPAIAIAWGAIKGGVSAVREKRTAEFLVFVQDHCSLEQFKDEQFVDGLGLVFEAFMRERNAEKREAIKKVFNDFVSSTEKEAFEIERCFEVLKILSVSQVQALRLVGSATETITILEESKRGWGERFIHDLYSELRSLDSLGLVYLVSETDDRRGVEKNSPDEFYLRGDILYRESVELTEFGGRMLDYLDKPL
jgi:hypothetical protein